MRFFVINLKICIFFFNLAIRRLYNTYERISSQIQWFIEFLIIPLKLHSILKKENFQTFTKYHRANYTISTVYDGDNDSATIRSVSCAIAFYYFKKKIYAWWNWTLFRAYFPPGALFGNFFPPPAQFYLLLKLSRLLRVPFASLKDNKMFSGALPPYFIILMVIISRIPKTNFKYDII